MVILRWPMLAVAWAVTLGMIAGFWVLLLSIPVAFVALCAGAVYLASEALRWAVG